MKEPPDDVLPFIIFTFSLFVGLAAAIAFILYNL